MNRNGLILKDGDLISLRGFKDQFVYCNNEILSNDLSVYLEEYDKDLKDKDNTTDFDIMEIKGYRKNNEGTYDLITIFKRKEKLLTDREKEYLQAFIKPFRDQILKITKLTDRDYEFIRIDMENIIGDSAFMDFPIFEKNAMYKNMRSAERYTLEELGL